MTTLQRSVPKLVLRPLQPGDEEQARAGHAELAAEGNDFLLGLEQGESWEHYLRKLAHQAQGYDLPDGWVPAKFLAAVVGPDLVGRISIRLDMTPWLAEFGGHIGYMVRPQFRRHGYATEMLRQAISIAADDGLERILITCDEDNVASARVIERCGGVLESVTGPSAPGTAQPGRAKRRYWIDLQY